MNKINTVLDLFNGPLYEVSAKIERADILLQILEDHYFVWSAKAVNEDSIKLLQFRESYEQIQMLLKAARDYTWDSRKLMDIVDGISIKEMRENEVLRNG